MFNLRQRALANRKNQLAPQMTSL
ncbi:MAG: hypothetical protein QOG73_4475, partial [Acetobacteraceae bacterium]|nr:hypothetical protein [Acetobacteraceae bacterium]